VGRTLGSDKLMNSLPGAPITSFAAGLSWYDFICPFCYVGQERTAILRKAGIVMTELPFQAHPDIPVEGAKAGPRTGYIYHLLEEEAEAAGLTLRWPSQIPNSRLALAAAEWVRREHVHAFRGIHKRLFEAHFVRGEDLGDPEVIDEQLMKSYIDPAAFWGAIEEGAAEEGVTAAESMGRFSGVTGTPAWLVGGRLIIGLQSAQDFEVLAAGQRVEVS
jgi:predicted DsbA family dithiol-disulfide isomerase